MNQHERYRLWFGGIAGGSFVAVTQLMTRDELTPIQKVAVGCFALTLPLAVCFLVSPQNYLDKTRPPKLRNRAASIGALITLVFVLGVGVMFAAFGPLIGLIFLGGIILASAADRYILGGAQNSADNQADVDGK